MYGAGEFDAPDGFAALHHAAGVLDHAGGGPEGAGRPAPAPAADFFCRGQCVTFTGMIPVFEQILILFGVVWYVVYESGMHLF